MIDDKNKSQITIIPKIIENQKYFYKNRQLTATAIMKVLKHNFPASYTCSCYETHVILNNKKIIDDRFADDKNKKKSCCIEVIGISFQHYGIINVYEIEMLFNCMNLYIKVHKSKEEIMNSDYNVVVINNELSQMNNYYYYDYNLICECSNRNLLEKMKNMRKNNKFKIVLHVSR